MQDPQQHIMVTRPAQDIAPDLHQPCLSPRPWNSEDDTNLLSPTCSSGHGSALCYCSHICLSSTVYPHILHVTQSPHLPFTISYRDETGNLPVCPLHFCITDCTPCLLSASQFCHLFHLSLGFFPAAISTVALQIKYLSVLQNFMPSPTFLSPHSHPKFAFSPYTCLPFLLFVSHLINSGWKVVRTDFCLNYKHS